jgi:hypothetical protein
MAEALGQKTKMIPGRQADMFFATLHQLLDVGPKE